MRLRLNARRSFQYQARDSWAAAFCHQLDRAISPVGTASLILGLIAAAAEISVAANYLMATGLLFHLTVWFAGWLASVTRH
jgi:hypothetical protein